MANLPSQHPSLAIHLSDLTLTPLISSSSNLESLTSLASSAIASHTSAHRAHLGRPQRIMVEYPDRGPVLLHTYLDPRDAALPSYNPDASSSSSSSPSSPSSYSSYFPDEPAAAVIPKLGRSNLKEGRNHKNDGEADVRRDNHANDSRAEEPAPFLVGLVVAASPDDAAEARRAATRLERVGRDFQREWIAAERSFDSRPD
ncbi:hypothetical protein L249_1043 [Ophiocordyceps polyrhachis-furcata BCC 54312]|uniref:Uncharacterized protein n=1 Tax=Ophiocordyceps polyrhachis-furcata BCC 54312 TaxID=1330021 RepID=A0A367LEB9_9HYPO|nr:hypothetical protein L249_1043 [Ophiocordyceps polyrhachis-furcata BCC 54312]